MAFNWTERRWQQISKALDTYEKAIEEARTKKGFIEPVIPFNSTEVTRGKLQPGNYNEFRRLVSMLDSTKPSQFLRKGTVSGTSAFDERVARMYTAPANKQAKQAITNIDKMIDDYANLKKTVKDPNRRIDIEDRIRELKEDKKVQESYIELDPLKSRSRAQYYGRVSAKIYEGSEGAIHHKNTIWQQNYMTMLRKVGLADVDSTGESSGFYNYWPIKNEDGSITWVDRKGDVIDPEKANLGISRIYAVISEMTPEQFREWAEQHPEVTKGDYLYLPEEAITKMYALTSAIEGM